MNPSPVPGEPLRILMVHNFYQEPGGEDQVFRAEKKLLEDHGHEVITYTAHNDAITDMGKLALLRATFWSRDAYSDLRSVIRRRRPQVMHAHNTFPLISPSAYAAARVEGVPVVQTLHNFRLLCANVMLLRNGAVCERCVGRAFGWPAILGRCYRSSATQSAVVSGMVWYHRARRTWAEDVDVYVALTSFARDKFVAGGLPAERIVVKPNFVEDAWANLPPDAPGEEVLFVGRLAPEKGIATMLAAWRSSAELPVLRLIGDGPMRDTVLAAAATDPRIVWVGQQSPELVRQAMRRSAVLLVPSLCYEGAPLVIVEAFSAGLPIIGSAHGAPGAQIEAGITGLHHRPGDAEDLAQLVRWSQTHPDVMSAMRVQARKEYLEAYSTAANYRMLLDLYARARRAVRVRATAAPVPELTARSP